MLDWIGQTISKVVIVKLLASGGMAEVFLGHHVTLDRPVAVKVLHSHLLQDVSQWERFQAEAQSLAGLRHPNIVQVYDFDVRDGRPYIVMELLQGMTLGDYLHDVHESGGRLPPETAVRLVFALASALDYAHQRGIIHRDVKPENVILRREAGPIDLTVPLPLDVDPVLTDFGLARFINLKTLTAAGDILGTPSYLSPEQALGEVVDGRSDLYSLGVILYELLAGRLPFESANETPFSLILKHVTQPAPPVPGLHPALQAVLDHALAKDREERYQKASEFAFELAAAVFGGNLARSEARTRLPPLAGLLEALDLLVDQARAYEHALPARDYPSRAAVSNLGDLARRALEEARDLSASLEPSLTAEHPFSPREHQVLALAAHGLTNKEIAYRLGISERTIQFHMNSVFNKTGTGSRTEAVTLALKKGWL